MSTNAPRSRMVDALSGEKAPGAFFKALSEADDFIRQHDGLAAELDELHSLRTRVAELEGALKLANREVGYLIRERDMLASDLVDLREAHQVTVTALARYQKRDGRAGW